MKVIIETPNFKARQPLLDFVQEKVDKLQSFSDKILESRVYLKLGNVSKGENKMCEIKLFIPGNELFASGQSNTFEGAVVQATEAVKHQLERWKESGKKRKHKTIAPLEP